MYEHNALGYWSDLALCLTKVRSSRACCPATALIAFIKKENKLIKNKLCSAGKHVIETYDVTCSMMLLS